MRIFTTKAELRNAIEEYFDSIDISGSYIQNTISTIKNYFNGTNKWTMEIEDIGSWNTSKIIDMSNLFRNIKQISIKPITLNLNTCNVINMSYMFYNCKQDFILNFIIGNVKNMSSMFWNATNFNQPLNFNTSKVTNMSCMFMEATNFNEPLNFDTRNVSGMLNTFCCATNFNQPIYIINNIVINNIFTNSPLEGKKINIFCRLCNIINCYYFMC